MVATQPPIKLRLISFLRRALDQGVSSLHFEPQRRGALRIRARVGGTLTLYETGRGSMEVRLLLDALKQLASVPGASKFPRKERALIKWRGEYVPLRVSTLPSRWGELVVAEVVDTGGAPKTLGGLGMGPSDLVRLRAALDGPPSMILAAGPARSGKRTFLNACLRSLAQGSGAVFSIAQGDPDLDLDGITQVELHPDCYFTREAAIRSVRSLDPNAIHIDRMESAQVTELAVRSAVRGYRMLSSVYAVDAAQAVLDLADEDVDSHLLTQAISTVVATRLPKRLCPACREPSQTAPKREVLERLAPRLCEERLLVSWNWQYHPRGCKACAGSGYRGRVGLFEVLHMEPLLWEEVLTAKSVDHAREVLQARTRSLREQALLLAAAGELTVLEALRTTPPAPGARLPSAAL